jgi:hypothetical protein
MQAIRVSLKDPVRSVMTMRLILHDTKSNLRIRPTNGCQFYGGLMAPVNTYKYVFFGWGTGLRVAFYGSGDMV